MSWKATRGNNVREAALLLLECARRGSFAHLFDFSGIDTTEIEKEISRQKLSLMVANDVCGSGSDCWRERVLRRDDASRRAVSESIDLLSRRFEAAGVRAVVLKGLSFERCIYGNLHLRDLGDIDLLVDPADSDAAHKVLLDLGYRQQVGPSSATGAASKGYAAIYAAQNATLAGMAESSDPLRRNPRKHEYIPYVIAGHPAIELHDGFCGLPARFTETLLEQTSGAGCHLVTDSATNLVLLLASAYENSESFYSNSFDRSLVLRDYVDLRRFFERYWDELDWPGVSALIESAGMRSRSGVVLRNLDDIFGGGADFGCLFGIERLPSVWGVGVAERLTNDDAASGAALSVFRNRLAERARSSLFPILNGLRSLPVDGRDIGFSMVRREDSLLAVWSIPASLFSERYLHQVCLYPLKRGAKTLAYKIDLGYYDGELRAYGHATSRFLLRAAVLKKTNCGIPVGVTCGESHATVEMRLDLFLGRFGIDFEADEFAVSVSVCEWNHGNVFWDILPERTEVLGGVELGRVGLVLREGSCLSLRFSEECYLLSIEDGELAARFREAFPQAVDGWLVNRDSRTVRSLRITGRGCGPFSVEGLGFPAEGTGLFPVEGLTAAEVSYHVMQAMSDGFCSLVHGFVFVAHAAALRWKEGVVVLMGASGSGKTSLAVAASRFMPLMGDECVFVDAEAGQAWCEDFPVQVKDVNGDILDFLGRPDGLAAEGGPHGRTHYYSRMCLNADASPAKPGGIVRIVFPEYDPSVEAAVMESFPLSRFVEGVLGSFMGECSPAESFKAFSEMLARFRIEVALLRYGNALDAAKVLRGSLQERE